MSQGEIVFYSGVALFICTIIVAILFTIKKPEYKPENEIYKMNDARTETLLNSYPTYQLTVRKNKEKVNFNEETSLLEETSILSENIGTSLLDENDETVYLEENNETEYLK